MLLWHISVNKLIFVTSGWLYFSCTVAHWQKAELSAWLFLWFSGDPVSRKETLPTCLAHLCLAAHALTTTAVLWAIGAQHVMVSQNIVSLKTHLTISVFLCGSWGARSGFFQLKEEIAVEGLLFLKGGMCLICFYENENLITPSSYFFQSDYHGWQISNELHAIFFLHDTFWKTQNIERTAV